MALFGISYIDCDQKAIQVTFYQESIYVRVYEDRIDLLWAAIVGPAGTPYHDGLFIFDVRFPSEYPKCPPKFNYHSGGLRLNPNLYESGKVCLSLLNTWWGGASQILPYCSETAFLLSCKTMLYSLRKSPKHFETRVARHFHECERDILDACSYYMSGAVVGSSVGSGARYTCDKCFTDFKKSLALYTEHLRTQFAANISRLLELERQASDVDEIVPDS